MFCMSEISVRNRFKDRYAHRSNSNDVGLGFCDLVYGIRECFLFLERGDQ